MFWHMEFQHTAARRRLPRPAAKGPRSGPCFNTQPPEGGCAVMSNIFATTRLPFQHTAARRRLPGFFFETHQIIWVSTHSRPKAAAAASLTRHRPPMFQHTAARRRLPASVVRSRLSTSVSTHSRPKAAAWTKDKPRQASKFQHTAARRRLRPGCSCRRGRRSCFNTQPPEGGCSLLPAPRCWCGPCFNTQPPEGGCFRSASAASAGPRFNTQPPEGGCAFGAMSERHISSFQHTAARRRLPAGAGAVGFFVKVSTHSRPKAAACSSQCWRSGSICFNTQPPEGGCRGG